MGTVKNQISLYYRTKERQIQNKSNLEDIQGHRESFMKNQDKNITILENVMERLELTQPVSNEVKKYIESSEKDQYKKILKRVGQLGILSGIFIGIYYFLKKFGLSFIANKFI